MIGNWINENLSGPMASLFAWPNAAIGALPDVTAKLFAVLLFLGGIAVVFILRKEYVNVDRPGDSVLYDLRLWTILSMLPHVVIYLYF